MDFAARLVIELVALGLFLATVALWAGIGARVLWCPAPSFSSSSPPWRPAPSSSWRRCGFYF